MREASNDECCEQDAGLAILAVAPAPCFEVNVGGRIDHAGSVLDHWLR
jgi:hypothetical protein